METATEAAVKINYGISGPELCLACSLPVDSTADGCAVNIKNNLNVFFFNITQYRSDSPVLLDCFPIQETGEYTVTFYEIQGGSVKEKNTCLTSTVYNISVRNAVGEVSTNTMGKCRLFT